MPSSLFDLIVFDLILIVSRTQRDIRPAVKAYNTNLFVVHLTTGKSITQYDNSCLLMKAQWLTSASSS